LNTADADGLPEEPALETLIQIWLGTLPPETTAYVRLGAIPQMVDAGLLSALLNDEAAGPVAWDKLRSLNFVFEDREGRLVYTQSVREVLLAEWWATAENIERYRRANRDLLPLLESRVRASSGVARQFDLLRWVYHALAADETMGLALVDEVYSYAQIFYQLALAERMLARLQELDPILNGDTRNWLRYFQADLKLSQHREVPQELAAEFEDLAQETNDERLRALARLKRGYALLAQFNWSNALAEFESSLAYFQTQSNDAKRVDVLLAIGHTYTNLAEKAGGLSQTQDEIGGSRVHRLFRRLASTPLVLFRFLVERWLWLSSLYYAWGTRSSPLGLWLTVLYVGTAYQDWIVARLMVQAIYWYRRAEFESRQLDQPHGLAIAQEQLAVLYYQLGHRRHSQALLRSLLVNPWVRNNPYRLAQAVRSQGEIDLAAGRLEEAEQNLTSSLETFESLDDWESIGSVALSRGRGRMRGKDTSAALEHFGLAIDALGRISDDLGRTEVVVELESVLERVDLSQTIRDHAQELRDTVTTLSFIERFPGEISRRFWWPNIIAAISVWLIVFIAVGLSTVALAAIEAEIYLDKLGLNLLNLIGMVLTPLMIIWGFQIVYTLIGSVFYAWRIPIASIEEAQPRVYTCDPSSVICRKAREDESGIEISWQEHPFAVSNAVYWVASLLPLLSRLTPISRSNNFEISGTVGHFGTLKRAIARQVESNRWRNYEVVIFSKLYTAILLLICVILGFIIAIGTSMEIERGLPGGINVIGICIEHVDDEVGSVSEPTQCGGEGTDVVEVPAAKVFWGINLALLLVFPIVTLLRLMIRRKLATSTIRALILQ
jgi:tetratricopeptide (TPR) repeat protein